MLIKEKGTLLILLIVFINKVYTSQQLATIAFTIQIMVK